MLVIGVVRTHVSSVNYKKVTLHKILVNSSIASMPQCFSAKRSPELSVLIMFNGGGVTPLINVLTTIINQHSKIGYNLK